MIIEGRPSISKKPVRPVGRNATNASTSSEKPPPYTAGSQNQQPLPPLPEREASSSSYHASSSRQPSTSGSSSRFVAPLRDTKPPIHPGSSEHPQATVQQVHLSGKNEDIIGTFYIDPQHSIVGRKQKKSGKQPFIPNASFRTRTGAIQLALGTSGDAKQDSNASVQVSSRTGNIEINLLPTPVSRPRLALDVQSRQGDVCVHIPESYSGMIQLNTRKGGIQVLSALMQRVKVLKATDKETILLLGASQVAPIPADVYLTDLCQITTTSGRAIVGLAGIDKPEEKEGFWKKLGQFFRGD